jgi:inner membrane protein
VGGRESIRLWGYPVLLAALALGFDAADRRVPFSILGTGLLDEPAHLATGALGLLAWACFIDALPRFYVAALIASVAIDLDHIPMYLGLLGNNDQRPVTHSLATVIVVAGAAIVSRRHRAVLAGIVTGLLIHFARDIAEGPPGVRMLWPLQDTASAASYRWFLGMILTFTAVRLILVSAGVPRTRAHLFSAPTPGHSGTSSRTLPSRHLSGPGGDFDAVADAGQDGEHLPRGGHRLELAVGVGPGPAIQCPWRRLRRQSRRDHGRYRPDPGGDR